MITMNEWVFCLSILGAALFGAAAVIGLLFYCVQDDRHKRAKARRQRNHGVMRSGV